MKLFVNCRAYAFDALSRTYTVQKALLVDGARFGGFDESLAGVGVERIDLEGACVVPAFADCHVHLTDTGYMAGARDLGRVRSAAEFEARIGALPRERFVVAGGYDESRWVDGASAGASPLDVHLPEAFAMCVRVDGHSCLVNRKTLAHLGLDAQLPGLERDAAGTPTGRLFLEANWLAQSRFFAQLPIAERRAAERRAGELALREGAVHLHAQLLGFDGRDAYAAEIDALRSLPGLKIYPKICERDPALARSFGLPYIGGDVFLDGSIGSGTAAVTTPYCSAPFGDGATPIGRLALDDADVAAYFSQAERLGVSAGVHAIGDRAIEQCLATWEQVLDGKASPRNRHFIEHFEIATREQIARCARLGIYLSMQPQFDADWGGDGGMYEARLGPQRMRAMNALGSAVRAGATVCGGDDSPVCRLSPLAGMAAACAHHTASERLAPLQALTMYTYDAARLGHAESHAGVLAPGYDADFVVLDRDAPSDGSFAEARVAQTWANGERVYPA
ncbi:MAG: amidohydrolase family protein [Candidatus Eremiobacteraeota bacterium]|nr:amidohydrolase family protein [Candidatus Eremiobacteraeota bacterium]MBC5802541.1 amidohydrolase family protein [Candidatus Eremiobacteraeota bacterium]MBC5821902.1 amidohydrolase family protein [Candidatus Eremiobacteraeota bacterium]